MKPVGFVLVSGVQLGTFVAPLVLARLGLLTGEVAGLVAPVGWFLVGMPLSYAVGDKIERRKALIASRDRNRPAAIPVQNSALYSR